jgi:beta-lactamase class D
MKFLGLICFLAISLNLNAFEDQIDPLDQIQIFYKTHNVEGSLLIESDDGKQVYQYNIDHNQKFVPASTFKIANTLIILEEQLIKNTSEIIPWDGVEREYAPWNIGASD